MLVAGVVARIIAQPLAQHDPFAALLAIFSLTLLPLRRDVSPHEILLWAAPAWLFGGRERGPARRHGDDAVRRCTHPDKERGPGEPGPLVESVRARRYAGTMFS
jgi:hypothetical protein